MPSSVIKLLVDCFKTLADGPKTGLLAARAISSRDAPPAEGCTSSVGSWLRKQQFVLYLHCMDDFRKERFVPPA